MIDVEEIYMRRALQLAKLGDGAVSPNPMVGAVIVCDGKIIGEGYHREYGSAHAEVNAIASVKNRLLLKESTLYVTLEPCSHYGKTPPCSELIIKTEIPRVAIGCLDPFKKVRGHGVEMLQNAGVEVEVGVLEDECNALNVQFLTSHKLQRPYILLKWAQSADGYIDSDRTARGEQFLISNPITSMWTHRERAHFDAIIVGSNTVFTDNPALTVRNWKGRNPIRVVIDRQGIIQKDSKLLNDGGRTIIFSTVKTGIEGNVEYILIDNNADILENILKILYQRNITSLMVEGGELLLNSFINSYLWDKARIEKSNITIGRGICAPNIKGNVINVEMHGNNRIESVNQR